VRVAASQRERTGIIEGDVRGAAQLPGQAANQGGLAGLARPVYEDNRGVREGGQYPRQDISPEHGVYFTAWW